jgi:16S rRNA (adenine1518-N6/adenine1519-N6)-dimethyltransferase
MDIAGAASDEGTRLRIVGNIPYRITTPILFFVLENRKHIRDATLMMQREVARRLAATPGSKDYGILSVFSRMAADVHILFDVRPTAFTPQPRVVSSVIHLDFLDEPRCRVNDEEFFRRMVRAVFNKRRKTLRNSLTYFLGSPPDRPGLPVDLSRRPEDLSLEELVALSNSLAALP